ncbi:MAG: restriction endonuclease subunit S [Pseudonocardiaceae bacterium]
MSDWRTYQVSDLAEIFDGPHATPKKTASGPWFLSITSLKDGRLDLSESAHLSEDDFTKWTRRVTPQPGDILFSYETRIGEVALMPKGVRGCLGRRMALMRAFPGVVDTRFLLYSYLGDEFQQTIRHRTIHGATVDRIPLTEMPTWPIRVPDLTTQRAIADLLGVLDDKIVVNERIAATARSVGAAHFASAAGRASSTVRVASVVKLLARGITPRYTNEQNGTVILNQKCIRGGKVSLMPSRLTVASALSAAKILRVNDVLVNSTGVGTLGRVALWVKEFEATVDSHISIVRFDPTLIDPVLAGFAMLAARQDIEALGDGSTGQTELSRRRLGELEIRVPDVEKLPALTEVIRRLEEKGDRALMENEALVKLRDALLPKLISGALRVKDAERHVEDTV